jgi:anti-anti-sigma regulatory factor
MEAQSEQVPKRFRLPKVDPHLTIEEIRLEIGGLSHGDRVELDLREIEILDSMLLGQILKTFLIAKEYGVEFQLLHCNAHARWVIHQSNLDSVFGLPRYEPPRWDSDVTSF